MINTVSTLKDPSSIKYSILQLHHLSLLVEDWDLVCFGPADTAKTAEAGRHCSEKG